LALGRRGGGCVARIGLKGVRALIKAGPSILACVTGAGAARRSRARYGGGSGSQQRLLRDPGARGKSSGRRACAGGWPKGPAELGWSTGQRAAGRGAEQRRGCPATILGGGKGRSCQRARLDRETGRDAGDAVRAAAGAGVRARGVWERGEWPCGARGRWASTGESWAAGWTGLHARHGPERAWGEKGVRARTGGVRAAGVGRAREGRVAAGLRFAGLGYWVLGFLSFILLFSNSFSHSSSTI